MGSRVIEDDRARYRTEHNREPTPCASDANVLRPEVYEAATDATWIDQECCTTCGWWWCDIADHDQDERCCPGDHRSPRLGND
jgi:hypothetical protein